MGHNTTVLCTIDNRDMEKIDKMIACLNAKKDAWQRDCNRQAIIRCLVEWALKQGLVLDSRYSKEVYVVRQNI